MFQVTPTMNLDFQWSQLLKLIQIIVNLVSCNWVDHKLHITSQKSYRDLTDYL